jgi:hypothetical protein
MDPLREHQLLLTRRSFFKGAGIGIGALATLLADDLKAGQSGAEAVGGLAGLPHFPPTAKRVIYLFQGGGPSQLDLFDYKPGLTSLAGSELPDSVRNGQRLTGMTTGANLPIVPTAFKFAQHGKSGAWVSELMPSTSKIVDDVCFIKSAWTEQINHDPGVTFFMTGFQLGGRPSIGSWVSYGLGSENKDLPAFVVLISRGSSSGDQALAERQWGSGFLPSRYQGVKFRSAEDPVLYLSNPAGMDSAVRRRFLSDLAKLNEVTMERFGDPEVSARIAQYEMASRMQTSVPELTDLSKEPASVFDLYGPDSRKPGTFAANCLLARRMAERGVRFIQLFHRGWDQHSNLPTELARQCKDTDQPSAALIQDLKQRGLLDDTLVIWGGEFGRTVYGQYGFGGGAETATSYGRDHHGRCFPVWMAGGGIKAGVVYGESDDFSYNVARDPVHVHDLQATILNCLGIDHTRLTYRYQGRDFRLTDVAGTVVKNVLS